MILVGIRLGELEVEIQSDQSNPDHLDDITNRAIVAFTNAVAVATESQLSIYGDELESPEE